MHAEVPSVEYLLGRHEKMKFPSHICWTVTTLLMTGGIVGCSDSSTDPANEEPRVERPGFTASVSGAVNAQVSEEGIVTYLPPKTPGSMTESRPGYFLLANTLLTDPIEGKSIMITFRIPDGAQPGDHHLKAADPRKVGEHFDVQVETIEKGEPMAFYTNTEGTITLEKFFPDRTYPGISNIKGRFQFVTENTEGKQVSVNGSLDFPSGKALTEKGTFPSPNPSRA